MAAEKTEEARIVVRLEVGTRGEGGRKRDEGPSEEEVQLFNEIDQHSRRWGGLGS